MGDIKTGSFVFCLRANRSTWGLPQFLNTLFTIAGFIDHSDFSIWFFLDRLSDRTFKWLGTCLATIFILWRSAHRQIWDVRVHIVSECVPPWIFTYAIAVMLSHIMATFEWLRCDTKACRPSKTARVPGHWCENVSVPPTIGRRRLDWQHGHPNPCWSCLWRWIGNGWSSEHRDKFLGANCLLLSTRIGTGWILDPEEPGQQIDLLPVSSGVWVATVEMKRNDGVLGLFCAHCLG